jgi:hypothetical protein
VKSFRDPHVGCRTVLEHILLLIEQGEYQLARERLVEALEEAKAGQDRYGP